MDEESQSNLVKGLANGGFGAMFLHSSFTPIGFAWDVVGTNLMVFNAYQILVQHVEEKPNFDYRLFRTLSPNNTIASMTNLTNSAALLGLSSTLDKAYEEVENFLFGLPMPMMTPGIIGIVTFGCVILMPYDFCLAFLGQGVGPALLEPEELDFLVNDYFPTTKIIAENEALPVSPWIGFPLFARALGFVSTSLWALVFQENIFPIPILDGPFLSNACIGSIITPVANLFGYLLHGTKDPVDKPYNEKENYPGGSYCNKNSPHALWHQESAYGQFHFAVLADIVSQTFLDHKERQKSKGSWFSLWGSENSWF